MGRDKPLYEDREMTIGLSSHLHDDYYIIFHTPGKVNSEYKIQPGLLGELAVTTRDHQERNLRISDEGMVADALERGLSIDSLGCAFTKAFLSKKYLSEFG